MTVPVTGREQTYHKDAPNNDSSSENLKMQVRLETAIGERETGKLFRLGSDERYDSRGIRCKQLAMINAFTLLRTYPTITPIHRAVDVKAYLIKKVSHMS